MASVTVLSEFIIRNQQDFPYASGDLTRLLNDISVAAKIVNREVNKAGLVNILGDTGTINVQGEEVKLLDDYANQQFISALKAGGQVCAIATEENEEIIPIDSPISKNARYVIAFDPLDGSTNIDVNVSIGTIFSIYRRISLSGAGTYEDFLQRGSEQVAAGYIIYGSSTMLVYTTGKGVNGFTLDPSIGEFCLSHPDIKIPKNGHIYSVNQGHFAHFPEGVKRYIKFCQEYDKETGRPYTLRYIGSLVADFHRNIIKGGIFIYPSTAQSPKGKLRLLYECNPLAWIAEQSGGKATNGCKRILEVVPQSLHQRSPYFAGPADMVDKAEEFMTQFSSAEVV